MDKKPQIGVLSYLWSTRTPREPTSRWRRAAAAPVKPLEVAGQEADGKVNHLRAVGEEGGVAQKSASVSEGRRHVLHGRIYDLSRRAPFSAKGRPKANREEAEQTTHALCLQAPVRRRPRHPEQQQCTWPPVSLPE